MNKEEQQLFKQLVQGVLPMVTESTDPVQQARDNRSRKQPAKTQPNGQKSSILTDKPQSPGFDYTLDRHLIEPVIPEAFLFYQTHGLQSRTIKQLKSGQLPWEESLDLHGYTFLQAAHALHEFMTKIKQRRKKCVRIIHGKGRLNSNGRKSSGDRKSGDGKKNSHRRTIGNTYRHQASSGMPTETGADFRKANAPILKAAINHWLQRDPRVLAFCSAQSKDGGYGAIYLLLRSKN